MSSEEYWKGDPQLAVSFREAHEMRMEMRNQDAWWQGFYFHEAVAAALSHKGRFKYPKRPHELKSEQKSETAEEVKDRLKEMLNLHKAALERKYGGR